MEGGDLTIAADDDEDEVGANEEDEMLGKARKLCRTATKGTSLVMMSWRRSIMSCRNNNSADAGMCEGDVEEDGNRKGSKSGVL